ncbi:DNA ligase, partial [Pantoea agglomerans]
LAGGVIVPVEQMRLVSNAALRDKLKEVVAAGGEGLMLHRADAPLASGRSDLLLKLKPHEDAEAVVVGHEPGKGRLAGQLGALELQ